MVIWLSYYPFLPMLVELFLRFFGRSFVKFINICVCRVVFTFLCKYTLSISKKYSFNNYQLLFNRSKFSVVIYVLSINNTNLWLNLFHVDIYIYISFFYILIYFQWHFLYIDFVLRISWITFLFILSLFIESYLVFIFIILPSLDDTLLNDPIHTDMCENTGKELSWSLWLTHDR